MGKRPYWWVRWPRTGFIVQACLLPVYLARFGFVGMRDGLFAWADERMQMTYEINETSDKASTPDGGPSR